MLDIMVGTFLLVCVVREISQITNDLAQIIVPEDNASLFIKVSRHIAAFSFFLFFSFPWSGLLTR